MYTIVEIWTKRKVVAVEEDFHYALKLASRHSHRTGMLVEVINPIGLCVAKIQEWNESDYWDDYEYC
jgi:hypothetical protein